MLQLGNLGRVWLVRYLHRNNAALRSGYQSNTGSNVLRADFVFAGCPDDHLITVESEQFS